MRLGNPGRTEGHGPVVQEQAPEWGEPCPKGGDVQHWQELGKAQSSGDTSSLVLYPQPTCSGRNLCWSNTERDKSILSP